jgi:hypothetical protein
VTTSRSTLDWDELRLLIVVDNETATLSSFDEDIAQISEVALRPASERVVHA